MSRANSSCEIIRKVKVDGRTALVFTFAKQKKSEEDFHVYQKRQKQRSALKEVGAPHSASGPQLLPRNPSRPRAAHSSELCLRSPWPQGHCSVRRFTRCVLGYQGSRSELRGVHVTYTWT